MNKMTASLSAAAIATVVLSLIMLIKSMMGMVPQLNVINMIAGFLNAPPLVGWLIHFTIGIVVYGVAYAVLFAPAGQGKEVLRALLLVTIGWSIMMVIMMPLLGQGLFGIGMGLGAMPAIATLVLHLVFGGVLGLAYDQFNRGAVSVSASSS